MKSAEKNLKYRHQLFVLQLKKVLLDLPELMGLTLVLAAFFALAAAGILKLSGKRTKLEIQPVALVCQDTHPYIKAAAKYLEGAISVKFLEMTKAEAIEELNKGTVSAVLEIPQNVIRAIMDSKDGTVVLTFPYPGRLTSFAGFQNLAKTVMRDIACLDAAEKLIAQIQREENGYPDYNLVYQIEEKLTVKLIARMATFENIIFSDSGQLDVRSFYAGSLIAALFLLAGIFLQEALAKKNEDYLVSLERIGIKKIEVSLMQYSAAAIVICGGTELLYIIAAAFSPVEFTWTGILCAGFLPFGTTALLHLFYQLMDNRFTASMTVFFSTLLMFFLGGNIIPLSLLPGFARTISPWLPTAAFASVAGQAVAGIFIPGDFFKALVWTGIFIAVTLSSSLINTRSK